MTIDGITQTDLKGLISNIKRWNERQSFKRQYQLDFLKKLVILTKSGMSLDDVLQALSEIDSMRSIELKVALSLRKRVNSGEHLHIAMEDWFDDDIAASFSVNQHHSSAQENIVASLIERSDWLGNLIGSAAKAFLYPLILAVLSISIMTFIGQVILPSITSRMDAADIPIFAQLIIAFSDFIMANGILLLVALMASAFVSMKLVKNITLPVRINTLDTVWPFNVYRRIAGYTHFSQFLKMVEWGDTPLQAAEKIKGYASPYVSYHFDLISQRASGGSTSLTEILDIPLLSGAIKTQVALASKANTAIAVNEILKQIPAVMQIETEGAVKKSLFGIIALFVTFTITSIFMIIAALLTTYSQIGLSTNIGY